MYAVTDAEFTAEGTADILVNKHMPLLGYPTSILSDNGLQFCSKHSVVIVWSFRVRKVMISAYHPNGSGSVERFNYTMAQTLAIVLNERQDNLKVHLRHVGFVYNKFQWPWIGCTRTACRTSRQFSTFVMLGATKVLPASTSSLPHCYWTPALGIQDCSSGANAQRSQGRASTLRHAEYPASKTSLRREGSWVWVYNSVYTIGQEPKPG